MAGTAEAPLQVPVQVDTESLGAFRAAIEQSAFEATSAGIARAQRLAGIAPDSLNAEQRADRRGAFAYQAFVRVMGTDAESPGWVAMSPEERRPWIAAGNAAAASG
jgi:hypothetical protein